MDRRGNTGNGGMRDYVDPWAHNGNNGNSPMMGGNGPLTNFGGMGNGNNGMGNMNLGNNSGPNNQNNGGGFGNNMDTEKTSTQVTIPKDVRKSEIDQVMKKLIIFCFFFPAGWSHNWQRWRSHSSHSFGVQRVHSNRRSTSRFYRSHHYHHRNIKTDPSSTIHASAKVENDIFFLSFPVSSSALDSFSSFLP